VSLLIVVELEPAIAFYLFNPAPIVVSAKPNHSFKADGYAGA
jgi:hypothetical protein